jgi:DNA-binding LytR/AlgR family response regulator
MNCIIIDDDPIIRAQIAGFINKSQVLNLVGVFTNPLEAYNAISANNIDLVFLDIEMPEMSGLEYLDESEQKFQVIIISGDRKYALDTFEYNVADYLLKPVEYKRFMRAVNKGIERVLENNGNVKPDRIFVKINNKFERIKFDDIISVSNGGIKKIVVTKQKSYSINSSIFEIRDLLSKENFIEISENQVVNIGEVHDVCNNFLIFKDSEIVESISVSEEIGSEILKRIKK